MAVRLAVYMKDTILQKLLARGFDAREKALKAEVRALGEKVYADNYNATERRLMASLPPDLLPSAEGARIKFAGENGYVDWGDPRPVAAQRPWHAYNATHPFTDTWRAIKKKREALATEQNAAKREARVKLDSCSTVGRLIEVWPEVKPFAERFLRVEKKDQLPIPNNDALNAKFGLPVDAPGKIVVSIKTADRRTTKQKARRA